MTSMLGALTYLIAFALLPAWFWVFHERLAWRFDDHEYKERNAWFAAGALLLLAGFWSLWTFMLPGWWKSATLQMAS